MTSKDPDFRQLFEHAPGLYLILEPDLGIVAVTNAYLKATMTKREDILGQNIFEIFPDNPNDKTADGVSNLRNSLGLVLSEKVTDTMPVQKYDIRKPLSEGGGFEERYWSPFNSPVLNEKGEVKYIIHRVEDVTDFVLLKKKDEERASVNEELRAQNVRMGMEIMDRAKEIQRANVELRNINRQLTAKTQELKRSNDDLSIFAATAAHDIKAPFRNVGVYLDLIKEGIRLKPGDEIYEYFERIKASRERISTLVDDLLKFARVAQEGDEFGKVDTSEVKEIALKNLESAILESKARLTFEGEFPLVKGEPSQILQLFQNLISNAIKFTSKNSPEVTVAVKEKGNQAEFSVKDNGIGIDKKYFSKIFEVFQRLHSQDEYVGTGLGLAICKRVVEKHGGRIWVESEPYKGTTFYFTLPLYNH
jgi:signal transduction histidine kinase